MEILAYTNNFYGKAKTKQRALLNLLNELESNNAQARMIKFMSIDENTDPFDVMEGGVYRDKIEL